MGRRGQTPLAIALILPVYLVGMFPADIGQTGRLLDIFSLAGVVLAVGIPFLIQVTVWLKHWRPPNPSPSPKGAEP